MKKLIDVLLDGLLFAFYMFASCLVVMLAEIFIIRVLTLFVGLNYFILCIIRAAIYLIGVNVMLALTAYRSGYKAACASFFGTLISGILALLPYFLFCLLFGFGAFCAGSVKFVTALVKFGPSLADSSFMGQLSRLDYIPVFFAIGLFYCILMAVSKKLGAAKRLVDRAELTANQKADE